MFDDLMKQIKKMERMQIKIDIPLDDNGYFDRICHDCERVFKVNFEDWKNIVKDEIVYCPICKSTSPLTEWNTPEQQEYINNQAMSYVQSEIGNAIKKDVSTFNRKQKPGFISMKLSYKPGNKIISLPPIVAEELTQYYTCSICKCRYSYLGAAYFCPACGNENIEGNTQETLNNIENFIQKHHQIREAFLVVISKEETESHLTQIIEEHFCKIVSVIQKYSEYLFLSLPNSDSIKIRKNIFQNLDESSKKWKELTGKSYEDIIDNKVFISLKEYFQMRHLLSHTGGIVDKDYLNKTNDHTFREGQRIIIDIDKLKDFTNCCKIFIYSLKNECKK